MEYKKVGNWIKRNLNQHMVDSTSLLTASTPLFAAFETYFAVISNENSINARVLAAGLTYVGIGSLYSKGLDVSRNLFRIKSETKEKIKQMNRQDTTQEVTYGPRSLEQITY